MIKVLCAKGDKSMKKEPTLVILAAGMGSRYGGLKQMDPVDNEGHSIIDFSIYDAIRAGFKNVTFIIKKEIEEAFKEKVGQRIEKHANVSYVFQELDKIPEGFSVPEGRTKPWGTSHALLCCKGTVDGPFAVINADDFYGREAFSLIYDFLNGSESSSEYAMIGYKLKNTLTENGYVSRGVCDVKDGFLSNIVERTHIEKTETGCVDTESKTVLDPECFVSMNLWGFKTSFLDKIESDFPKFLEGISVNPLKSEMYIPATVDNMIKSKLATVKVIPTDESWFGVTYKEDKVDVVRKIEKLKLEGIYPKNFLE
jgi:dTDP-glucose pyrophosphorylase